MFDLVLAKEEIETKEDADSKKSNLSCFKMNIFFRFIIRLTSTCKYKTARMTS